MRRRVPLPKNITFVTFDCYGTLIDWESGAYDAFQSEADRDGFTINRDELIALFVGIQHEVQSGSYELYAEVLRRTAVRAAKELGWDLESSRAQFLPDSVPRWPPFRETNAQLERFAKKFEIGILSNIDDKLLTRSTAIQKKKKKKAPTPARCRAVLHVPFFKILFLYITFEHMLKALLLTFWKQLRKTGVILAPK